MQPVFDAHSDFLMNLRIQKSTLQADLDTQMHVSLKALQLGKVKLQVFAAFVGEPTFGNPVVQGLEQVFWYYKMLDDWGKENIIPVYDGKTLTDCLLGNSIGALLSIEGGEALAGSLGVLDTFLRLGVRIITILWNHENEIGYPANRSESVNEPLKPFGRECIKAMCEHGVAIDVSHLNVGGFWDAHEHSTMPLMASHSNAHALCQHPRNLDDDQIRAIIESKGFIGLNFLPDFLTTEKECTTDNILSHARHILELGGEDILGFGSDFDGISSAPKGIEGAQSFQKIITAFEIAGIHGELLERIAYKNLMRYLGLFLK